MSSERVRTEERKVHLRHLDRPWQPTQTRFKCVGREPRSNVLLRGEISSREDDPVSFVAFSLGLGESEGHRLRSSIEKSPQPCATLDGLIPPRLGIADSTGW